MTSRISNSRIAALCALLTISSGFTALALADDLSAEEQSFFDKSISNVIQIHPRRLGDAAFMKVFSTPFYAVKVVIKGTDGSAQTTDLVVARADDKLVSVDRPSANAPLPTFPKLLSADFRLKTDADAKSLQDAMDVIYPIVGEENQKAEGFKHVGDQWIFMRGEFFEAKMGFVFDVDADGVVKTVKYMLQLP